MRRDVILLAAAAVMAATSAQAAERCDRACLTGLAERYMDALVARTPEKLPWAAVVRYAENSVPMAIGDGTWGTVTARSKTALEAADPQGGEVAWIGEVEEHGQPAFYAMRMKVEGGKIAGVEAVIRRKGGPPEYSDPAAWAPDPAFGKAEAKPLPRAQLVATANAWFDAQQGKPKAAPRFAADCGRKVNGVADALDCSAELKAGVFKPIEKVRARRFAVVDAARGVVIAEGFDDFPERQDVYAGRPAPTKYPYSLGFLAAFKITAGGIERIEAISTALPYGMPAP